MDYKRAIRIILFSLLYFYLFFNVRVAKAESLQNGIYFIKSTINEQYVFDVTGRSMADGANLEIWTKHGGNNQKFEIKSIDGEYYTISNFNSGKYLDVECASKEAGTNVIQYTYHGGDNQKWLIKATEDGYYNIISKCNDLCLDVAGSKVKDGGNILVWNQHGGNNQKFRLELYNPTELIEPETVKIQEGCYTIAPASNDKFKLDVEGASLYNCANIALWSGNGKNHQKFIIKNIGYNVYTIQCANSAKYMDVEGSSKNAGANILQYTYTGGENQQWIFKDVGDGYYSIVSKCNDLYADVEGRSHGKWN